MLEDQNPCSTLDNSPALLEEYGNMFELQKRRIARNKTSERLTFPAPFPFRAALILHGMIIYAAFLLYSYLLMSPLQV
jgi:hypothetical protein